VSGLGDIDRGAAGSSAYRENERRRAARERRLRGRFRRLGGVIVALQPEPQHERAWAIGGAAEVAVAAELERACPGAVLLHDRRMPRSRANIDHIAVAASGVWVIDTKGHRGRVELRRRLFGRPRLVIAGRDQSRLTWSLEKQVAAVAAEVDRDVPVRGVLCMANARLPMFGSLVFDGCPLLAPAKLARRLNKNGPISAERAEQIAADLASHFRPA
jgi:hypothetical protein